MVPLSAIKTHKIENVEFTQIGFVNLIAPLPANDSLFTKLRQKLTSVKLFYLH